MGEEKQKKQEDKVLVCVNEINQKDYFKILVYGKSNEKKNGETVTYPCACVCVCFRLFVWRTAKHIVWIEMKQLLVVNRYQNGRKTSI